MAGWNQKERPLLSNVFHVGDRVLLVNNIPVTSASKLWKMIKRADSDQRFDIIIRRLPFGKAYHIRRNLDFEDIGLQVKDDSAEVSRQHSHSVGCVLLLIILIIVNLHIFRSYLYLKSDF